MSRASKIGAGAGDREGASAVARSIVGAEPLASGRAPVVWILTRRRGPLGRSVMGALIPPASCGCVRAVPAR